LHVNMLVECLKGNARTPHGDNQAAKIMPATP